MGGRDSTVKKGREDTNITSDKITDSVILTDNKKKECSMVEDLSFPYGV